MADDGEGITDHFLPVLRSLGLTDQDLHKIMVDNPRRALTFTAPRPQASSPVSSGRH